MTKSKDDGGYAFPTPNDALGYGMTLRQWFAGQTLAGMSERSGHYEDADLIARQAYAIADEMLKARGQ